MDGFFGIIVGFLNFPQCMEIGDPYNYLLFSQTLTFPFIFSFFRLERVRQKSEYDTREPIPANRSERHQVCLFGDYAF